MKWYYCKRGDGSRRGTADDQELARLIKAGEIDGNDLVSSESTGFKWVSANATCSLFHDQPVEDGPGASPGPPVGVDERVSHSPGDSGRGARALRRSLPAILCGGLTTLVIALFIFKSRADKASVSAGTCGDVPGSRLPDSAEVTNSAALDEEILARSNRVAGIILKIERHLYDKDWASAESLIAELARDERGSGRVEELYSRLNQIRAAEARRSRLYGALKRGELDGDMAVALVETYRTSGNTTGLVAIAANMLEDRELLSPGLALSVARVAHLVPGESKPLTCALQEFAKRVTEAQSEENCIEASRLFIGIGDRDGCIKLLNRCIEDRPQNPALLLELAAVQAGGADPKIALKTLKDAVKFGGSATAERAAQDVRFVSLRGDSGFKRIVGN